MSVDEKACILVAEDEMLVAMMMEDLLTQAGYRALMVARLAKGLVLAAAEPIDAAILDINLAGQTSYPLADELLRRQIPFMFASGYGRDGLPARFANIPVLQKPYDMATFESMLAALLKK
jgi:DNA-binding response OmpR family regulator